MAEKIFKILIIDEQEKSVEFLKKHLETEGYHINGLISGKDVLELCAREKFDLILLSLNLSGVSGLEVCTKIKQCEGTCDIPVMLITSHREIEEKLDALSHGAQDFITKPFNMEELKARIRVALRVKASKDALKDRTSVLEETSLKDELTGLFNRRYIKERMYEEISRADRFGHAVSCIIFDVDQFKVINNVYGHENGDLILKEIAEILKQNIRTIDVLGRYGGEEFVIILPQTDISGALTVAEKLAKAIESNKFYIKDTAINITVSIGVASNKETDGDDLLYYADLALNKAKTSDKNKVVAWKKEK